MPHSRFAGMKLPLEKLPLRLRKLYPKSIYVKADGYFDFTPYAIDKVDNIELRGDSTDASRAYKASGRKKKEPGYTWHHHEDGITMQLVPRDLHKYLTHWGGVRTKKMGGKR
jgi:hypothetical protein